jgi:hypothetical protein
LATKIGLVVTKVVEKVGNQNILVIADHYYSFDDQFFLVTT